MALAGPMQTEAGASRVKPAENFYPGPPPIPAEFAGRCELSPAGDVEAGSWQSFTLTYTAGPYGMDDTASLKLVFRFV